MTASSDVETPPMSIELNPKGVAKMMEAFGTCIAMYQRIEIMLKVLLPHLGTPGCDPNDHIVADWRCFLDSKETLGRLINQYSSKTTSSHPETFARYLKTLIDNRNELVHHFFNTPIGSPRSDEELKQASAHLVDHIAFAKPFLLGLEASVQQFATVLEESIRAEEMSLPN